MITPTASATHSARSTVTVRKQRVVGAVKQPAEDDKLALEEPLEITIADHDGGATRLVTMRTPGDDSELIHGYLLNEGVIETAADIARIDYPPPPSASAPVRAVVQLAAGRSADLRHRHGAVQSSCGVCGADSLGGLALDPALAVNEHFQVAADWIHTLPDRMRSDQPTFAQTGGLHAAAIFAFRGELLAVREDIGRHNALDKAIGATLLSGHPREGGQVLCVSGRMSYEILQKALQARIAIIAGIGAPSSLAVAIANDFNLTLIGFVRGGSFNIYSCPERIA